MRKSQLFIFIKKWIEIKSGYFVEKCGCFDQKWTRGSPNYGHFWPLLHLLGRKLNCHNIFSNNIGQMFRRNRIGGSKLYLQRCICFLIIDISRQNRTFLEKKSRLDISYNLKCHVWWHHVTHIGNGIITWGSRGWNSIRFMLVLIILNFGNYGISRFRNLGFSRNFRKFLTLIENIGNWHRKFYWLFFRKFREFSFFDILIILLNSRLFLFDRFVWIFMNFHESKRLGMNQDSQNRE